jgi:hypothetical protein
MWFDVKIPHSNRYHVSPLDHENLLGTSTWYSKPQMLHRIALAGPDSMRHLALFMRSHA